MRESHGADLTTGRVVFVAELLGNAQAGLAMFPQEALEVLALDEVDLARVDSFRRQLVRLAADACAKTQNFAGFGDFQDQRLAVSRADRQFHATFAKDKDAARHLSFYEEYGTLGIGSGIFDGFKGL